MVVCGESPLLPEDGLSFSRAESLRNRTFTWLEALAAESGYTSALVSHCVCGAVPHCKWQRAPQTLTAVTSGV
jgi:hypothetical protein